MGQPTMWFPEVKEALRAEWRPELSWDELIALRDRLAVVMKEARERAGVRKLWCKECADYTAEPLLRVGAVISQTAYLGLQSHEQAERMKRRWAYQRKKRGLDLCGRPKDASTSVGCHEARPKGHENARQQPVVRRAPASPARGQSHHRTGPVSPSPPTNRRKRRRKPW